MSTLICVKKLYYCCPRICVDVCVDGCVCMDVCLCVCTFVWVYVFDSSDFVETTHVLWAKPNKQMLVNVNKNCQCLELSHESQESSCVSLFIPQDPNPHNKITTIPERHIVWMNYLWVQLGSEGKGTFWNHAIPKWMTVDERKQKGPRRCHRWDSWPPCLTRANGSNYYTVIRSIWMLHFLTHPSVMGWNSNKGLGNHGCVWAWSLRKARESRRKGPFLRKANSVNVVLCT